MIIQMISFSRTCLTSFLVTFKNCKRDSMFSVLQRWLLKNLLFVHVKEKSLFQMCDRAYQAGCLVKKSLLRYRKLVSGEVLQQQEKSI